MNQNNNFAIILANIQPLYHIWLKNTSIYTELPKKHFVRLVFSNNNDLRGLYFSFLTANRIQNEQRKVAPKEYERNNTV